MNASAREFAAPAMAPRDLVAALHDDCQFPCAEEDFKAPTPEFVEKMYKKIAESSYDDASWRGVARDLIEQHPELQDSEEQLVYTVFYRKLRALCGYAREDFSIRDLEDPKPKRTIQIASGLVNFQRHRNIVIERFTQIVDRAAELPQTAERLREEVDRLSARAQELTAENKARAPVVEAQKEKNAQVAALLMDLHKQQEGKARETEALKAQEEARAKESQALARKKEGLKRKVEEMKLLIVQPAEDLEAAVGEARTAHTALQARTAALEEERSAAVARAARVEATLRRLGPVDEALGSLLALGAEREDAGAARDAAELASAQAQKKVDAARSRLETRERGARELADQAAQEAARRAQEEREAGAVQAKIQEQAGAVQERKAALEKQAAERQKQVAALVLEKAELERAATAQQEAAAAAELAVEEIRKQYHRLVDTEIIAHLPQLEGQAKVLVPTAALRVTGATPTQSSGSHSSQPPPTSPKPPPPSATSPIAVPAAALPSGVPAAAVPSAPRARSPPLARPGASPVATSPVAASPVVVAAPAAAVSPLPVTSPLASRLAELKGSPSPGPEAVLWRSPSERVGAPAQVPAVPSAARSRSAIPKASPMAQRTGMYASPGTGGTPMRRSIAQVTFTPSPGPASPWNAGFKSPASGAGTPSRAVFCPPSRALPAPRLASTPKPMRA